LVSWVLDKFGSSLDSKDTVGFVAQASATGTLSFFGGDENNFTEVSGADDAA
jgi:hypothetical protein